MTQPSADPTNLTAEPSLMPSQLGQGSILIVDDSVSNLQVLSKTLAASGYDVRLAKDGPTALMMVRAEPPDLVLLDIVMPGMDGYDVCRQLKSEPATHHIPIIFISALDEIIDKVKGFELGGVDYVTKPFQAAEVLARVSTHLSLHSLQKQLHRRVEELSALQSIARTMATVADLTEALNLAAEAITHLFEAEVTLISVPASADTKLQTVAGFRRGVMPTASSTPVFPLSQMPLTRQVLDQGQPLILSDIQALSLAEPVRAYVTALDLHALMLMPLQVGGEIVGVLAVGDCRRDRDFTQDEVALAETIAGDIATTVKNAELTELARNAAVITERNRLARELHDSVTQTLYSVSLFADATDLALSAGQLDKAAGHLEAVRTLSWQAMLEMRLLIFELRPPLLEEAGLVGALQLRLEAVEARSDLETDLQVEGRAEGLPPGIEAELFHVALEALNNTAKHARAKRVVVQLTFGQQSCRLTVEDDGVGFDPDTASQGGGLGLVSMNERVTQLGGTLAIDGSPGRGTKVEVEVPYEPINDSGSRRR